VGTRAAPSHPAFDVASEMSSQPRVFSVDAIDRELAVAGVRWQNLARRPSEAEDRGALQSQYASCLKALEDALAIGELGTWLLIHGDGERAMLRTFVTGADARRVEAATGSLIQRGAPLWHGETCEAADISEVSRALLARRHRVIVRFRGLDAVAAARSPQVRDRLAVIPAMLDTSTGLGRTVCSPEFLNHTSVIIRAEGLRGKTKRRAQAIVDGVLEMLEDIESPLAKEWTDRSQVAEIDLQIAIFADHERAIDEVMDRLALDAGFPRGDALPFTPWGGPRLKGFPELVAMLGAESSSALSSTAAAAALVAPPVLDELDHAVSFPVNRFNQDAGVSLRSVGASPIRLGSSVSTGQPFFTDAELLAQHVLVTGQPGFGKTAVVRTLLERAWLRSGIPFLVVDPSNDPEVPYRRFDEAVQIRTIVLPDPSVRWNPLAPPEGVSVATHRGRFEDALDSVFDLRKANPFGWVALRSVLVRVYDLYDVDQVDTGGPNLRFPTLRDVYRLLAERSTDAQNRKMPSEAEALSMVLERIESLLTGSTESLFGLDDCGAIDWREVARVPTVLELGSISSSLDRKLVMALLVGSFTSFREANSLATGLDRVSHLLVIEEAHRVLSEEGSALADAIAELRSARQGIVVVEQMASRLDRSVVHNCATRLAFRAGSTDEALSAGTALGISATECAELGRLPVGVGLFRTPSDDAAVRVVTDFHPSPPSCTYQPLPTFRVAVSEPAFACTDCPRRCAGWESRYSAQDGPPSEDLNSLVRRLATEFSVAGFVAGWARVYCAASTVVSRDSLAPAGYRKAMSEVRRHINSLAAEPATKV
jgi:hypothetical protein